MDILETERLVLSELSLQDAPFILQLLNEPTWLKYIGDKGVRSLDQARDYITNGPLKSYQDHGFGLYLARLRHDYTPIGLCGLLKREFLQSADIGFAFLPQYAGQGYAFEAASATLEYAGSALGLHEVIAVTMNDNRRSIKLLERLGMNFEKVIRWPGGDECKLFVLATADRSDWTEPIGH